MLEVADLLNIHHSWLEPADHLVYPSLAPYLLLLLCRIPKPYKVPAALDKRPGSSLTLCLCLGSLVNPLGGSFYLPTFGASTSHAILPPKTSFWGVIFRFGKTRRLGVLRAPLVFQSTPKLACAWDLNPAFEEG